jgi:type I restriction-modification system DNA methylase subunit
MVTAPTIQNISGATLRAFFKALGYAVKVSNAGGGNGIFSKVYTITFPGNQPVPANVYQYIQATFPDNRDSNTPLKISLVEGDLVNVLPLFPPYATSTTESKQPGPSGVNQKEVNASRRSRNKVIADNERVLAMLARPDFETLVLTEEERDLLESYGGVGGQYSEDVYSSHNEDALTQFYTPAIAGEKMYDIAYSLGFPKNGTILEPSCGNGRLIKAAINYTQYANVTAFEVSQIPYRIAKKLYPAASIHNLYFEQAFLQAPRYNTPIKGAGSWLAPVDLVIGNPPYGKHANPYQTFFGKPKFAQIEQFFMYYGVKLLKPGGLLMYVTNSNFLRTGGSYQPAKEAIFSIADFETAFRMPNAFMELTEVSTDILVFRRKK